VETVLHVLLQASLSSVVAGICLLYPGEPVDFM
jgi:hypothetical protein